MGSKKTINYNFSDKHKEYIRTSSRCYMNVAEGAVRAGKTVDNVLAFAHELKTTADKIHLATGSTSANAKLNIGNCNGFGLEYFFRGQSYWGKYKGNECLYIKGPSTKHKERIVIFAGGGKADSFKRIRGNSYGMWIATEINLHHENTIKEAFNRTIASRKRKVFWDLNPDNPNATIYKEYIDLYRDKEEEGTFLGGYNYQHFTIEDNVNIPEERKEEIKSQYDKNSIWYKRDILGQRCVAEGLIYRQFADNPNKYKVYVNNLSEEEKQEFINKLIYINIGVDFGGNGSGHAFVCTGIKRGFNGIIPLQSLWINGNTDTKGLCDAFVGFVKSILEQYGYITIINCDSAEQVLIKSLKKSLVDNNIAVKVKNALKRPVNERIKLVIGLISANKFNYTENCESLEGALQGAVWDAKHITEDVRLDDGTSDIDTMDAFEYSIEKHLKELLRW